jgi:hypothetical protein
MIFAVSYYEIFLVFIKHILYKNPETHIAEKRFLLGLPNICQLLKAAMLKVPQANCELFNHWGVDK